MVFRLREILKIKRITIGQLSEMSGISQSNLSNYMMGKVSPTLETLNKIANALGIEIAELFRKEEDIVLFAKLGDRMVEIPKEDLVDFIKRKIDSNGNSQNQ